MALDKYYTKYALLFMFIFSAGVWLVRIQVPTNNNNLCKVNCFAIEDDSLVVLRIRSHDLILLLSKQEENVYGHLEFQNYSNSFQLLLFFFFWLKQVVKKNNEQPVFFNSSFTFIYELFSKNNK